MPSYLKIALKEVYNFSFELWLFMIILARHSTDFQSLRWEGSDAVK